MNTIIPSSRSSSGWTIDTYAAHNEALRTAFKEFLSERDRRYEERNSANQDAVRAALTAAEKSADKTERALAEYKVQSNEWRDALKDLVARMPTRVEVDQHVSTLAEKVNDLRSSRSGDLGQRMGTKDSMSTLSWILMVIMALITIGSFMWRASATPAGPATPQIIYVPAQSGAVVPSPSSQSQQK